MEVIYQKNNELAGISDRYIYLEEVYEQFPRMSRLASSRYISLSKPLVRTRKDFKKDYQHDKKTKRTLLRHFILCYAPENYLLREGYEPLTAEERLQYINHEKN